MFRRRQSQNINTSVMFSNRTAEFLHAPTHSFDLVVKRNADISGNVKIGGDLTVGGDINATNFRATGNFYLDGYVLIPAGTIIMSAINYTVDETLVRLPNGWLECNGAAVLRVNYADLFNAISTTYGSATITDEDDGFRLPNLKGRVPVGYDSAVVAYNAMGKTGGESTHTLTVNEMPSHSHTTTSSSTVGMAKIDGYNTPAGLDTTSGEMNNKSVEPITIENTGGGAAHNNMQPYIIVSYLIKY